MFTLNLHQLLLKQIGDTQDFEISLDELKDSDFKIDKGQIIEVQATKIDVKGITLYIPEQTFIGKVQDANSLEYFPYEIDTYPVEKRCYISIPEEEDPDETIKIPHSDFTIDITEMINETIFLNLPYSFHKDPEHKSQTYTSTSNPNSNNPFAQLKNLSQEKPSDKQ